jgi:hypothetical protein
MEPKYESLDREKLLVAWEIVFSSAANKGLELFAILNVTYKFFSKYTPSDI